MTEDNQPIEAALEGLDEGKRSTLKRLIGAGAFVRPIVVSFAMADLSIDAFMHAAVANLTTTPTTARPTTAGPTTSSTTTLPGSTTTTLPGSTTTTATPRTSTTPAPPKPHPTKS